MQLKLDDRCLYYETHGPQDGAPVVLLHHGLGSASAWKNQIPALAEAGYRVVVYDRWGYGNSDPRPGLSIPYFDDDQHDLGAVLEALAIEQASLVGHSDGGTLALYFAAHCPQRLWRLVVVAAHVFIEPKMKTGIQGVWQAYEREVRFRAGLHRVHGDKAAAVISNWYHGWFRPENLDWDMRPVLAQISCPVLVIQGSEDEYATHGHAVEIAAAIPGAKLWLEPGAGHLLPQDRPAGFNHRLLVFLRGEEVEHSG